MKETIAKIIKEFSHSNFEYPLIWERDGDELSYIDEVTYHIPFLDESHIVFKVEASAQIKTIQGDDFTPSIEEEENEDVELSLIEFYIEEPLTISKEEEKMLLDFFKANLHFYF